MVKRLLIIVGFLFIAVGITAQPDPPSSDEQLANQYYAAGEFDKAVVYYEKLYEKNPLQIYYEYYLNCLINIQSYKKAEKLVKKQSAWYKADLTYFVDMGRVFRAQGQEDKAKKEFNAGVNAINPTTSANRVIDLANAFLGINETDWAITTLQKGRKELKGVYSFHAELADVYYYKKDYTSMINEYLGLLDESPLYKQQVQNGLQAKMDSDTDNKISGLLKTELLKRSQREPNNTTWPELLVWLFMQEKNFAGALVQAKAIDKRKQLEGEEIILLAEMARSNHEYEVASDAYDYVIGLGPGKMYYRTAKMEKMNTRYERIVNTTNYTAQDLISLEAEMKSTLEELGKNNTTVSLIRSLAHLQAFYMDKPKEAVALLEEVLLLPGLNANEQALCKLELGDVLVLDGQVWEASLRYAQVEKAYKYDAIGQEAKFRNAKVAFYVGDFEWAQAQLNVLKGSTSKLISNDAMYLSMVITDNLALDSNPEPLMRFAKADLMLFQHQYDKAKIYLDSIDRDYGMHALADDVLFMRYRIAYKQQRWAEAAGYLQKLTATHSTDILADDAWFRLAELYEYKLGDTEKAKQCYEEIILKYPGSLFVVDARKRYRVLRGDKLND
jgi:tetratricopeptide (TPR) repeat protein